MIIEHRTFLAKNELDKQRSLYQDCFPEAHVAAGAKVDHYFWKFHQFPSKPRSFEFAAWDGVDLLGYYAAIPFPYLIGGRAVNCGMVCDVMTHSKARGRGVFTGIGRYSLEQLKSEGIGFVSGYPIRPEVLPGHLKVGWKVAFDLPLYAKVLGFRSLLNKARLGFLAPLCNAPFRLALASWRFFFAGARDKKILAKVYTGKECDRIEGYEEFISAWQKGRENSLVKSREFLAWRLGAPAGSYSIVTIYKSSKLLGLAVYGRVDFRGVACAALMDFMVHPEHSDAASSLHECLEQNVKNSGLDLVVSMMTKTTARRIRMGSNGFLKTPIKFQLILNILDETILDSQLFREENWDLMWIDSDDN